MSTFLYPANAWPHKNHETLLAARGLYRQKIDREPWNLVLTGNMDEGRDTIERISANLGIQASTQIRGFLPQKQFEALLSQTGAVVFASLYEGFGIPILEAMHCRIPVIAGRNGSIPEVAGNACLYTDVRDPAKLADAMVRIHTDVALRERLITAGTAQANSFQIEHEAATLCGVFNRAIAKYETAGLA